MTDRRRILELSLPAGARAARPQDNSKGSSKEIPSSKPQAPGSRPDCSEADVGAQRFGRPCPWGGITNLGTDEAFESWSLELLWSLELGFWSFPWSFHSLFSIAVPVKDPFEMRP